MGLTLDLICNCDCLFRFSLVFLSVSDSRCNAMGKTDFNSISVFFTSMAESRKKQELDEENEVFFRLFTLEEKVYVKSLKG